MNPTTIAPPIIRHYWVVLGKDYIEQDGYSVPTQTEEFQIALSEGETVDGYFANWLQDNWQIETAEPVALTAPQNVTEQEEF
ncbi:MAG: hypothetical protein J7647_10390 [Cyanobacteria bacterium SBLK]|nr:hypothetical protein [Cyanobacteria bacterium SBLK]